MTRPERRKTHYCLAAAARAAGVKRSVIEKAIRDRQLFPEEENACIWISKDDLHTWIAKRQEKQRLLDEHNASLRGAMESWESEQKRLGMGPYRRRR
jgi:hypothetical protein